MVTACVRPKVETPHRPLGQRLVRRVGVEQTGSLLALGSWSAAVVGLFLLAFLLGRRRSVVRERNGNCAQRERQAQHQSH